MKSKINRRSFIRKSSQVGMACCALMLSPQLLSAGSFSKFDDDMVIDPKDLNYCGYKCPSDCKFHIATLENDLEKKKEAFEIWKIKERYGVDFDPKVAICWQCKNLNKDQGVVLQKCTVRSCCMEKGYEACIECEELIKCDKSLWNRFPDFYKAVVEMQIKYKEQRS